ncbi:MAG: tRNA 2-thiouridine(34) synthase MnmA [Nitrospirae bacterium]|nr:tRNA 2-thiouridine(34) synthase MnmA [Nitrospirota bacterium]
MKNKKVVVGLSGGVDSAVAALLLVEQGYDVTGATLRIWEEGMYLDGEWHERSCCKIGLAKYTAEQLRIPYYIWDAHKEFKEWVVDDFCKEYTKGRTPNPCIRCNEKIKFSLLLEKARSIGADYIATGHYARISYNPIQNSYNIERGLDPHKDQSYFLYRLSQEHLSRTIFPVGDYTKAEVIKMAASLDLPVSEIRESQEVCFVTQEGYQEFIAGRVPSAVRPGKFITSEGKVLGEHAGIAFYTIGQRRGLRVAAGERLYVVNIDTGKNEIVLGSEKELQVKGLIAADVHMISGEPIKDTTHFLAKIRYRTEAARAIVIPVGEGCLKVLFEEPQRAVTPGQSVVFYDGETVKGGGIIDRSMNSS